MGKELRDCKHFQLCFAVTHATMFMEKHIFNPRCVLPILLSQSSARSHSLASFCDLCAATDRAVRDDART